MTDYLVEHARQNVWCSPRMDRQVIFCPKRITAPNGTRTYIRAMWEDIPLPNGDQRFHVFQIGQVHPLTLGLCPKRRVWYRLSTIMERDQLFADAYLNSGLQYPRTQTWVLYTEDRALLVAVADLDSMPQIRREPLYVRLYSNTFFSSDRADDYNHRIQVSGRIYTDLADALSFQQEYLDSAAQPRGLTSLYINGRFQKTFLPQNLRSGDSMEYVYDSTVKQVLEFPLSDAPTFTSELDSMRKYLLMHGGDQVGGQIIDYRDDIDVYLVKASVQGSQQQRVGHYVHKNLDSTLRMVTYRDYSISIPAVQGFIDDHPELGSFQDLIVRLHVRNSGYARPLVFEHHRIHELYKLPWPERRQAVHGSESTVSVWQAAALENSVYTRTMDAMWSQITLESVQEMYGYNAMSVLAASGPMRVTAENGVREVKLPRGLWHGATMWEYDSSGELLGFYHYVGGSVYRPYNTTCTLVEGIPGRGVYKLNTVFGTSQEVLKSRVEYRFYVAPIAPTGVRHDQWTDVTGSAEHYTIIDGRVQWLVNQNFWAVAVKSDEEFLAYRLVMSPVDGLLKFSIDGEATYPAGSIQGVMFIPPGKLELWLNRRKLIENLDYFVKWPEVVIVNKEYLNAEDEQVIHVRGTGFCKTDMSRETPADHGYVRHGRLSLNTRFNVRDDRLMSIAVRGCLFHRDDLKFSEDDPYIHVNDEANGSPYVVDDVVVPMRDLVNYSHTEFRERSRAIDQEIEDYLTLKLPELPAGTPNMSPNKYRLFSPFASVVMHHLVNGFIDLSDFRGQYSDRDVLMALAPYEYLLDYEPTRQSLDLDLISIHPHNKRTAVTLTIFQRNFLARAVKVFLDDKVDLSQFIEIDTVNI